MDIYEDQACGRGTAQLHAQVGGLRSVPPPAPLLGAGREWECDWERANSAMYIHSFGNELVLYL